MGADSRNEPCFLGRYAAISEGAAPPEAIALSAVVARRLKVTFSLVSARRPPFEGAAPRKGVALRLGIWRLSDMRQNAVEFVEGIVFDHQPALAFGIVVEADLGAQRFR